MDKKVTGEKQKVYRWHDVDEVVKATIEIPKRLKWIVEVMEEVPKGEKSSK